MGLILIFIGLIIGGICFRYIEMVIGFITEIIPWKAIFIIFGIILLMKYVL